MYTRVFVWPVPCLRQRASAMPARSSLSLAAGLPGVARDLRRVARGLGQGGLVGWGFKNIWSLGPCDFGGYSWRGLVIVNSSNDISKTYGHWGPPCLVQRVLSSGVLPGYAMAIALVWVMCLLLFAASSGLIKSGLPAEQMWIPSICVCVKTWLQAKQHAS